MTETIGDGYTQITRSEATLRRELSDVESRLARRVHELEMRLIRIEGEVRRLEIKRETTSDFAPLAFMVVVTLVIVLIGAMKR